MPREKHDFQKSMILAKNAKNRRKNQQDPPQIHPKIDKKSKKLLQNATSNTDAPKTEEKWPKRRPRGLAA